MEINVHLYLHIHVKIQCWFPLDQCVWMDKTGSVCAPNRSAHGPHFPTLGIAPHFSLHEVAYKGPFSLCTADNSDMFLCSNIKSQKSLSNPGDKSQTSQVGISGSLQKGACLYAPELLLAQPSAGKSCPAPHGACHLAKYADTPHVTKERWLTHP